MRGVPERICTGGGIWSGGAKLAGLRDGKHPLGNGLGEWAIACQQTGLCKAAVASFSEGEEPLDEDQRAFVVFKSLAEFDCCNFAIDLLYGDVVVLQGVG